MTPQGKKRLIIGTAILVICGVVGYFIYKKIKDSKPEEQPPAPAPDSSSGGGSNTYSGGGNVSTTTGGNPFSSSADLKKFQEWVINIKKDANILGKGGADGKWGSSSANAWTKYGAIYQKDTTPTTPTTPTTTSELLDEVQKNLGVGTIPVERYTDKVIARTPNGYTGYFYAGISAGKPLQTYVVTGKNLSTKQGRWSNGGKTIVMQNGRVISSGSVWDNIKTSANA